jgi:2-dehydropantoate 2-reductase
VGGGGSARADAVAAALAQSGVDAAASPDVRRELWQKFAFLSSTSAVTAATRLPIGTLRANPATRALLRDAMAEVVALARAEGVHLADDFVAERMRFVDALPAGGRASMAQDLLRGARLELDWLSGAVVRRGERAGLPTPIHRTLHAALAPFAEGAPPDPA